jgi:hypothetical protein
MALTSCSKTKAEERGNTDYSSHNSFGRKRIWGRGANDSKEWEKIDNIRDIS